MAVSQVAFRIFLFLIVLPTVILPLRGETKNLSENTPNIETGLVFRPARLDFGQVPVGKARTKSLTILNNSNSEIMVPRLDYAGGRFAVRGLDLPLTLAAGQSFTFMVTFAPLAEHQESGNISLPGEAADLTAQITGRGSAPLLRNSFTGSDVKGDELSSSLSARQNQVYAEHSVYVTWDESKSRHVVGYNLFRGTKSGGPYKKINQRLISGTHYTDDGLLNGMEYFYVATAVNSKGRQSVYSKQVHVRIP
jgi:Abnormal spindle-like microcephaly-assoc'd, ASPM-SPD-2-Hydin